VPRASKAQRRAHAAGVVRFLEDEYPEADCALRHDGPFQLLAATILSAQCTDERVNMVTPELFARWPDPAALAQAEQEDVEEVVRSTGFYRNKAKNLIGMARGLVELHGGDVPEDMDALVALPGVARKTANVVLGTAFGRNEGVVVDTHVHRISHRLGLSRHHDPKRVERDLMDLLPREEWTAFSHRVIFHGRRVCVARSPRCALCGVRELCPSRQDVAKPRKLADKKKMTTPSRRRRRKGDSR
jgi:endonuclease-3